MPTIISRRKIAFFNPNIPVIEVGDKPKSPKYQDAVFITKGNGELENAPEWVNKPLGLRKKSNSSQRDIDINAQNLNTWKLHEDDGHIMEVDVKKGTASGLAEEAAARQAENARKAAEKPEVLLKTPDELSAMNKNELLDYAEETYNLKITTATSKADIIAAITNAQVQAVAA
jgi:hypothetical protein